MSWQLHRSPWVDFVRGGNLTTRFRRWPPPLPLPLSSLATQPPAPVIRPESSTTARPPYPVRESLSGTPQDPPLPLEGLGYAAGARGRESPPSEASGGRETGPDPPGSSLVPVPETKRQSGREGELGNLPLVGYICMMGAPGTTRIYVQRAATFIRRPTSVRRVRTVGAGGRAGVRSSPRLSLPRPPHPARRSSARSD